MDRGVLEENIDGFPNFNWFKVDQIYFTAGPILKCIEYLRCKFRVFNIATMVWYLGLKYNDLAIDTGERVENVFTNAQPGHSIGLIKDLNLIDRDRRVGDAI